MLSVSELYIYPVKSLGGVAVKSAKITSRGFKYDRRLMLVDANNKCLTQRDLPEMAMLQPAIEDKGFAIVHKKDPSRSLFIPHQPDGNLLADVTIWDDICSGKVYQQSINNWFTEVLNTQCRLIYMPDSSQREIDKRYAHNGEVTSFADEYPLLIIGQASLDDLNNRLEIPVPINRFRPNIVFTGGTAFQEDEMDEFLIGDITFNAVKPCKRCVIITINQHTKEKSKEPSKTLATYRFHDKGICFGQNLLHKGDGVIHTGDAIEIKSRKTAITFNNKL